MVYALQYGIELTPEPREDAVKKTLISWMVRLEQEKAKHAALLAQDGMGKDYVEAFALRVFKLADDEDRAGHASMYVTFKRRNKNLNLHRKTAQNFLAASQFLEVLKQFGPVSEDVS